MIGVYAIVNELTGDMYVGQSSDIERRYKEHCRPCNADRPISAAIQKYGKSKFFLIILEECPKEELADREEHWIALLKPHYNISKGRGCSGVKYSEEQRSTISKRTKAWWKNMSPEYRDEYLKKLSDAQKGKTLTDEAKAKISAKATGRIPNEETRRKMSESHKRRCANGYMPKLNFVCVECIETGEVFDSVMSAAEIMGVPKWGISAVLHGKQKTTGGYSFRKVI